ncbi:MAG: DUF1839 family protein [Gammaproteobacteria bacterium]
MRAHAAHLDPKHYARHELHSPDRIWTEKNCYIDIWIELVHSLGLEAHAMMPFTVAVDFEGDQWTFFKPPHEDLKRLYGIDVQELYVWRPLLDHCDRASRRRQVIISTEADAFWLPDTAGSDYRSKHTKTTIVMESVDLPAKRLGYFHNAGYFTLEGEDFVRLFRVDAAPDPEFMPMFAELVRCDRLRRLDDRALRAVSRELLRKHIEWRPAVNPIPKFRERFERDLPELAREGMGAYHAWVFGTLRQLGAAAELSALYLNWLDGGSKGPSSEAAEAFLKTSTVCKSLVMKTARAVNSRRPLDASASFEELASAWQIASTALRGLA